MIRRDRKPKVDAVRRARFREIPRDIVWTDRDHRKYGRAVDTGGAIARALERAYREGFAASMDGDAGSTAATQPATPPGVVEWGLIPPRPRTAFWSICLAVLGRQPGQSDGCLIPAPTPRGTAGWQITSSRGLHERIVAEASIRPLLRFGLLAFGMDESPRIYVTDRGRASWEHFLALGGQFPDDSIGLWSSASS